MRWAEPDVSRSSDCIPGSASVNDSSKYTWNLCLAHGRSSDRRSADGRPGTAAISLRVGCGNGFAGSIRYPRLLRMLLNLSPRSQQRWTMWRCDAPTARGILWVEPNRATWSTRLAELGHVLARDGLLVIVASRPMARLLPERRSWSAERSGPASAGTANFKGSGCAVPHSGFRQPMAYIPQARSCSTCSVELLERARSSRSCRSTAFQSTARLSNVWILRNWCIGRVADRAAQVDLGAASNNHILDRYSRRPAACLARNDARS